MKTNLQQEILLMTGTYFSSRQCLQNMNPENNNYVSESAHLQDACWNGLLYEMLPEICMQQKEIYLWQIRENKCCLEIELGEFPLETDPFFSIDPYTFLTIKSDN